MFVQVTMINKISIYLHSVQQLRCNELIKTVKVQLSQHESPINDLKGQSKSCQGCSHPERNRWQIYTKPPECVDMIHRTS